METFAICSLTFADWMAGAIVWLTVGPIPGVWRLLPLGLLPITALAVTAYLVFRRRPDRPGDRSQLDHLDAILDADQPGDPHRFDSGR